MIDFVVTLIVQGLNAFILPNRYNKRNQMTLIKSYTRYKVRDWTEKAQNVFIVRMRDIGKTIIF